MDDGRTPVPISRDAKYTGCFLLVTFLLRQKKSNEHMRVENF